MKFMAKTRMIRKIKNNDPSIWYNNPEIKNKVELIRKQFGEPFLITKGGEMLYEHCVVIPAFRNNNQDQNE